MKIALIHLSDMHISDKSVIHMEKIQALADSLSILTPFEGLLIVVSGDVAGKGLAQEYNLAERFFSSLLSMVQRTYCLAINNTKLVVVPGNHDMDRNISSQSSRTNVIEWAKEGTLDSHIIEEINRCHPFYQFAREHVCFLDANSPLYCKKTLAFTDNKNEKHYIDTVLLNSAPFSNNDDNGIHYYPESVLSALSAPSKAPFSIVAMHHSPSWFSPEQKVRLQKLLYSRNDIVFCGHEHYDDTNELLLREGFSALIQAGGAWWEPKTSFNKSTYYAGVLDTDTRHYRQFRFVWNCKKSFYEHESQIERELSTHLSTDNPFTLSNDFVDNMVSDERQYVCGNISDYFVFPTLQTETAEDYSSTLQIRSMAELIETINANGQLMILGPGGCGKTTLARMLFLQLAQEYTVLICGLDDIAGKKQKNIIHGVFENIYPNDSYSFFEQQDKKKKIIIIDDSNLIRSEHLSKLLRGLTDLFAHIVVFGERETTFDLKERVTQELSLEKGIKTLTIGGFYADKRSSLIERILKAKSPYDDTEIPRLKAHIEKALSLQDIGYKINPTFIVKYTVYVFDHLKDMHMGGANVFSKVFESSIEVAIAKQINRETTGQILTALGDVAYLAHTSKAYPISSELIEKAIAHYNSFYGHDLSSKRFIDITTDAHILVPCSNCLSYRFKDREHYAYFIAQTVMRKYNENDASAEDVLQNIIQFSCFSINPMILKFIAYSTSNIKIISLLLDQAISCTDGWEEYDIHSNQPAFLSASSTFRLKPISHNSKKEELEAQSESEKQHALAISDTIEAVELYDYDTSGLEQFGNQITRAFMQMQTIASCLVSFEHMMPVEIKDKLISLLYTMPNKIFYRLAHEIDNNLEDIVVEILKEQQEQPDVRTKKDLTRNDIIGAFQKTSLNLLLNLYYSVAANAATQATLPNLSAEKHVRSINNKLEKLMFYEQAGSCPSFVDEALKLYETEDDNTVKNLIRAMAYHLLVWTPASVLSNEKRDRLIGKMKLTSSRKNILAQNIQNRKR